MIEFTFDSLFRTTNKGLPDTSNLPPYSYITMNHFVFSLLVEIILALVITIYTALAVYRAFYRIKNPKFNSEEKSEEEDEENEEEEEENEKEKEKKGKNEEEEASETNDNLIYRFDDDESEKDAKEEKKDEEEEEEEDGDDENKGKSEEENYEHEEEEVSEETTEWFLDLDHKMLFFQPFLISFVVVVNVFASNIIVLILLGLGLVFFYLFNVKGYCGKKPILQVVFTLPCIVVLLMVYFEDKDMST